MSKYFDNGLLNFVILYDARFFIKVVKFRNDKILHLSILYVFVSVYCHKNKCIYKLCCIYFRIQFIQLNCLDVALSNALFEMNLFFWEKIRINKKFTAGNSNMFFFLKKERKRMVDTNILTLCILYS